MLRHYFLIVFFSLGIAFASGDKAPTIKIVKPYSMSQFNSVIKKLYQNQPLSHSLNLQKRLLADSEIFLGKPYVLGSLGEGEKGLFDQEPLYRTDEFDCMTFVGTILALIESNNLAEFKKNILAIRYANGKPSFLSRNHFAGLDWNINNERKGYIKDIVTKVFPNKYAIAEALINKPQWYAKMTLANLALLKPLSKKMAQERLQQLQALGNKTIAKDDFTPYIPLAKLYHDGKPIQSMFAKIPSPVIIQIVRPNWNLRSKIGTNLNVSHLGFAVRINGKLYFREASSIKNKVVDVLLEKYLRNYLNSATVKGINILDIENKYS